MSGIAAAILCLTWGTVIVGDDPEPHGTSDQLTEFRDLVGTWHGVGQPRRGSTRGAWQEDINWHFDFEEGRVSLECISKDSQWMQQARLQPTAREGEFELQLRKPDRAETNAYIGRTNEAGSLIFSAKMPVSGTPERITLRLVADGDRLVMLLETRAVGDRYSRLAEVGYTRHGADFARESFPRVHCDGWPWHDARRA